MVRFWKLGLMSFDTATKIQQTIARQHLDSLLAGKTNTNHFNTLLLLEHKPVYTIGIRDKTSKEEISKLKDLGADFRKTNRGGLITFHGPGQLVAYPIINLKHFTPSIKWYVDKLEETVIQMAKTLGLEAKRSEYTGVWVGDNKLSAIGIHASRYVTTHGISLNCNNDLSWFKHIDPCGIQDKGVTSLSKLTDTDCTVQDMMPFFIQNFSNVFDCELEELDKESQKDILNSLYNKLLS